MDIKQVKDEALLKEYQVVIPAADIEKRVDSKLQEIAPNVKMDGFRPGKIPMDVLRKRYGPSAYQEVLEALVGETTDKLIKDNGLKPAMAPQYRPEPFENGGDFKYGCVIELLPEISDIALDKLKLTRYQTPVAEADLKEALTRISENNKETVPVKKERPVKKGDVTIIDFKGYVDDKPLPQGEASDYELVIGSNSFIEGFEEQLIGLNKGESKTLELSFPKEYHVAEIAGKPVKFDVTLKELHEQAPAKVDDALAKRLGLSSLEDLETQVKGHIANEHKSLSDRVMKQNVLDALDKEYAFDLPKGMVQMEFEGICQQLNQSEDTKAEAPTDEQKAAWESEYMPIAERRVRLGLVLSDIARKQNIVVSPAELQGALMERARSFPGQEQQVIDYYKKNQDALASLKAPLLEDKVINYIVERANVTDKEVSVEEMRNLFNNEEKAEKPKKKKAAPEKKDK